MEQKMGAKESKEADAYSGSSQSEGVRHSVLDYGSRHRDPRSVSGSWLANGHRSEVLPATGGGWPRRFDEPGPHNPGAWLCAGERGGHLLEGQPAQGSAD